MTIKVTNIFHYKDCTIKEVFKTIKIRFLNDDYCDLILQRLNIKRGEDVNIKYEKIGFDSAKKNYVELSDLPPYFLNPPNPEFTLRFASQTDIEDFYNNILEIDYKKEKGIFYPEKKRSYPLGSYWVSENRNVNKYPIFIISKGRYDKKLSLTHNILCRNKIKHFVVVEECEYKLYCKEMTDCYTTVISMSKNYNNLGQGSIPVRNWVDDYSRTNGYKKYWCIDDNIKDFYFFNKNTKRRFTDSSPFRIIEDLSDRYKNLYMSGMNYYSFVPEIIRNKTSCVRNTRIYSCILMSVELKNILDGVLWRGKYNEDTDLSLRLLKKGYPTILSNQYLCDKSTTMSVKGGNTSSIYQNDGLQKKLDSLIEQHPDVVKGTIKFKKVHHEVNYKPFSDNKLEYRDDYTPSGTNFEYGLKICCN